MLNQKGYFYGKEGLSEYEANKYITYNVVERFAPIYDNGSSLGRELSDIQIERMLKDKKLINNYIQRGKSEIRWFGKKLSHFDLLKLLDRLSGYAWFDNIISNIKSKYSNEDLYKFLQTIDVDVPDSFKQYKLSDQRKELILLLIEHRIDYLRRLFKP